MPSLDGRLDIGDPIWILEALFRGGRPPDCPDAADANDDGSLTSPMPSTSWATSFSAALRPRRRIRSAARTRLPTAFDATRNRHARRDDASVIGGVAADHRPRSRDRHWLRHCPRPGQRPGLPSTS